MSAPIARPTSWRDFFVNHTALAILLMINLSVFVLMVVTGVSPIAPTTGDLIRWGGTNLEYVQYGESWRLFTSMFVHAGLQHLVVNMLALYIAIGYLKEELASWSIVIIYLICGIISAIVSCYWNGMMVVSVGASGAISGFFGLLLVWSVTQIYAPEQGEVIRNMVLAMVGLTAFIGFTGLFGNMDNGAHLGGFVTGVIIGAVLRLFKKPVISLY